MIDEQILLKENGYIFMKMNSITDMDLINKLVEASKNHVKIDLIVRGICCILPNVKGYSENITIRSIVGRFLEHSRIYLFGKTNPKVYISSADMMTRNTTRRVEIACPIIDKKIKDLIVSHVNVLLNDNYNAKICLNGGTYTKIESDKYCNSHEYFLEKENKVKKISYTKKIKELLDENNIQYRESVVFALGELSKKFNFYIEKSKTYVYLLNVKSSISYNTLEKMYLLSTLLGKEGYNMLVVINSKENEGLEESLNRIRIKYCYLDNICVALKNLNE